MTRKQTGVSEAPSDEDAARALDALPKDNEGAGSPAPSSTGGAGSEAVLDEGTRILVHIAESALMWASAKHVTKVPLPGREDEYTATVESKDYPVHFTPSPIEGSIEACGGSAALITHKLAKEMGIPFDELCRQFIETDRYGLDYAFLDDKEAVGPVLERMRVRAAKYEQNLRVAMAEGIQKSTDLVVHTEE